MRLKVYYVPVLLSGLWSAAGGGAACILGAYLEPPIRRILLKGSFRPTPSLLNSANAAYSSHSSASGWQAWIRLKPHV